METKTTCDYCGITILIPFDGKIMNMSPLGKKEFMTRVELCDKCISKLIGETK